MQLGFLLDPLAAAMLVMIALVGLCIFVFSVGYMADDKNFIRFFACGQDITLEPVDDPLPDEVASGAEPFRVVAAMAGG